MEDLSRKSSFRTWSMRRAGSLADDPNSKDFFHTFDQQSYKCLTARITQAKKDYGFVPRRNPTIKDGAILPKTIEPVPDRVYGRPLEELDGVSYDKTFCVISKRFSKNYLNRFSATRAFFIFAPWNPVRRVALFVSTNQYFDYIVILTILVNCVFLTLPNSIDESEYIFLSIYTTEMVIKSIAKGFLLNKYTYLRNAWNWLDFVVIVLGFVTIFVELGNLSSLRTFRVLRALKTVSILPGLKTIVNALLHSISMLTEVMALTVFCLMVFALFGLQIFMGAFRRRCIDITNTNISDVTFESFIRNESNWYKNGDKYQLCGNATGAWFCPENHTCFPNIGENPNFGYTSFDNFGWAMLATFQLLTLDFWEDIYDNIIATCGPISVIFFIFMVFFGAFYLINLMLAVVAMSYEEEVTSDEAEKRNQLLSDGGAGNQQDVSKPRQKTMVVTRRGVIAVNISQPNLKDDNKSQSRNSKKQNRVKGQNYNIRFTDQVTEDPMKILPQQSYNKDVVNIRNLAQNETLLNTNLQNSIMVLAATIPGSTEYKSAENSQIAVENGLIKEVNRRLTSIQDKEELSLSEISSINNSKKNSSVDLRDHLNSIQSIKSIVELHSGNTDEYLQKVTMSSHKKTPVVVQTRYVDRNCRCCQKYCCSCLYYRWLKFQRGIYLIVQDPFFELFITLCIILNTLLLAIEHHGMSPALKHILNIGNKVFTIIFTLEAVLKLLALSKRYFRNGWNNFDLIAVMGSLIDLSLENFNGLSVLRALRLLRVFKLAQSWTTMKMLLTIIFSTAGSLGNLTLVLLIVMYIFAILGMQLFGSSYKPANFYPEEVPRWNFKDFTHSFLMTFRILCGEWIEALWDCMRINGSSGQACIALFLPALIMESFLVLNLFLALLLSSFNSDKLANTNEKDADASQLAKGIRRLKYLLICCFRKRNSVSPTSTVVTENSLSQQCDEEDDDDEEEEGGHKEDREFNVIPEEAESLSKEKRRNMEPFVSYVQNLVRGSINNKEMHQNGVASSLQDSPKNSSKQVSTNNGMHSLESLKTLNDDAEHKYLQSRKPVQVKVDGASTVSLQRSVNFSTHTHSDEFAIDDNIESKETEPVKNRLPEDCFPENFYKKCSCCSNCVTTNVLAQTWFLIRKSTLRVVDHPAFEWIILILIIASSICLCFEDIYLEHNKPLKTILYYLNIVFTILFTLEMLLKWLAHGFVLYFTNVWTILDFIIVLVAVFSLLAESSANLTAFRSMRTLRALRPLRAVSRWQGMKIVVNALVSSFPSIINVLLVCVVFWLVFSIMGVQFFAGKFYKCVDQDGNRLPVTEVNNRSDCFEKNFTWENSNVNFDNVGEGFLALFQIATFEGWLEILADAADARDVDEQPDFEANMLASVYFIIFIVCGSFFTLNLFIGVIIDNFNMLKKKYEGGVLDMFLTDSQKNYYAAMKKLGRKKPQKLIKRPKHCIQIFFYNLCLNRKFEMGVFLVIMLNMMCMGVEHYEQPPEVTMALDIINIIFTTIFTAECLVKIIAFRHYYFTVPWNVFDFILVGSSIMGIILKDLLTGFFISPTLLRVIRVFRIGRVLRLIKAAKGIRKLIFALMVSLPALFNIGALLFLIMFIYAIMGMSLFGYVKHTQPIDDMTNFETFGNSMMLLFRLITSAGWSDILGPLMIMPPDCDPHYHHLPNGNCGNPTLAIVFLVSYIIINNMIIINMYIAVILENFNQAHQEEELGIVEDDIEMFYVHWANFDPLATQFINLYTISDFLGGLDPPLRVPKPNSVALVSFNLPIARGNKIHCLDILHALIKHALGHVDETADFKKLRGQMEEKFKKQFPNRRRLEIISSTMQWKQQEVAARVLQKAFRQMQTQNKDWAFSLAMTAKNNQARFQSNARKCSTDVSRSQTVTSFVPTTTGTTAATFSNSASSSNHSLRSVGSNSNSHIYVLPGG